MRIAIMGTGGVGGYFGGRLAASGVDVTFIARGAHLAAIQRTGLRVVSPNGDIHLTPTRATDDPSTVGPVDYVLLAVKLYDVDGAVAQVGPLVGPETAVVTLQNGVTSIDSVLRVVPRANVMGGVARISADIAEPGVVRQTGKFADFVFGELDGTRTARGEALLAAAQKANIAAEFSGAIETDIWRKFVFLASFSAVTSASRLPIGPIRKLAVSRALLQSAVAEATAVAAANGISLGGDFVDQVMGVMDNLPAEMKSSMLVDLERGRRLEVSWLSGEVSRLGAAVGVATPVHDALAAVLAPHAGGR
jgi:2-dehydropantoate 2-reductase